MEIRELLHSERLYYSDSFLKTFIGTVTAVRQFAGGNVPSRWQLALDRTAFYPTSGGQPYDTGVLRPSSGSAALETAVNEVAEDEDGTVWHSVDQALEVGTEVEGAIDWDRRFDHMQQHTGQHLLSAVFLQKLQAPTVSFHLGESSSTIDLAIAPPAGPSLESVEHIANVIIAENHPVSASYVSRADAEAMLTAGDLRKLPDREGSIRLIDIANCDRNACGGTHVRSTGQIGSLLICGTEKVSRGVRVEFVCGLRTIRHARRHSMILGEISRLLSTGVPELPATVQRLLTDSKTSAKESKRLSEELARFQAAELISEQPVENGLRMLVREWNDRSRDFVKMLASQTVAGAPSTAVVFCAKDSDPARVFLARSPNLKFHCGSILRDVMNQFGLRGGGSPDLAQGDVPKEHEQQLLDLLVAAIRAGQ